VLFARRGGVDEGFAVFRRTPKWEQSRPDGELFVRSLVGTPAACLALLRRLVDFDLTGRVKVQAVGVEDPVLLWAGGPRGASDVATYDNLWVRLVDVPEALQSRAWGAPCDVTVAVRDDVAPWNDGTWRIHVDGAGSATVERTAGEPDLQVPVSVLGAAYLGGGNLAAMRRAGLVAEHRVGAADELWRAIRTDVAPTAAWMF
jgi:predicted acetyltransferase